MASRLGLFYADLKPELPQLQLTPLLEESWPKESLKFSVAIQLANPDRKQFHAIALYRKDNRLMIGDLQSHLHTRQAVARPNPSVRWIGLGLNDFDQRLLMKKVDAWLTKNANQIPYSVAHPGGVIWKGDVWVGNEPGQGLTCATFIVQIFNELGMPFIDESTWEVRDGDEQWAQDILQLMAHGMTPEHVKAQLNRIGTTIRIRPIDVAAAAHLISSEREQPLKFSEVAPLASMIESTLLAS